MTNNKEEKRKKLRQEILDEKWEKIQRNRGKVLAEYKKSIDQDEDIQEPIEEIKEKTPADEIYLYKETREKRLISNKDLYRELIDINKQIRGLDIEKSMLEKYLNLDFLNSKITDLDNIIEKSRERMNWIIKRLEVD